MKRNLLLLSIVLQIVVLFSCKPEQEQVATPTFNPPTGVYTSIQSITISCDTEDAKIRYTIDGTDPSSTVGTVYSSAIEVSEDTVIKAIAYTDGMDDSQIASAIYFINLPQVEVPIFNPTPTGTYTLIQSVTISCATEGATIRYTTDESNPTQTNGEIYSSPIELSETTTIKAIAYKSGMANSQVVSVIYTMNVPQVETPVFSPSSGTILNNETEITITTATLDANIYYTIDGSTPTTSSELYSDANKPLVDVAHKTIKAIAIKTGIFNSIFVEGNYTLKVATPTLNPEGGTYLTIPLQIEITTITSGADIRYTLNGTTPTATTGLIYTGPISISSPKIVNAIAYKTDWDNSDISTSPYYIFLQITDGNWISGDLESGGERWYYFNAVNQDLYKIRWDDGLEGSGTSSCNVKVSAYRQDRTTPYFTEIDGGYNNPQLITAQATEEVYIKVEGYNPTESGNFALSASLWTQVTSSASLSARWRHTSVVYDNKMWVIGGVDNSSYKNDVWYSSDGITWIQATSPSPRWSARSSHTSVVYDNKMWVIGGFDGSNPKNDVWYSTDGSNWTHYASCPPRWLHTSVVYDNKMWVIGGYDATGRKNDVWYSDDGINWTQATSSASWSARYFHTSVVYDNKMWVIGGYDATGFKNDVWYSDDGETWVEATSSASWSARYSHNSVVYDDKMWVIGGNDALGGHYKNDVWYSTDGSNWTQATSSASWSARSSHTSVVYDEKMWVIGGGNGVSYKNDVWFWWW